LRVADRGRFQKQVALAEEWLRKLPGQNVLEAAAILTGLEDSDGDDAVAHCDRAIAFLLHAQTSDGGWGPFANSPPENFDTAAALLVLAAFRERDDVRKVVARGRAHLVAEQLADGSWTETTRPPGATSYAQRLSTTAWATLALLATSDGVLLGEW
jgi:squalene cyclase